MSCSTKAAPSWALLLLHDMGLWWSLGQATEGALFSCLFTKEKQMENQEIPTPASTPTANPMPTPPSSTNAATGTEVARKPCPSCGEMIAETAKKCRFCGHAIGVPAATVTSAMNTAVDNSAECLSTGEKVGIYLGVILTGLIGIVIVSIMYYILRGKHPQKAAQLNKHSWIAFGIVFLLCILGCHPIIWLMKAGQ